MRRVNDETCEDQTCGDLDTLSLKVFGVTRGLALPLSELLAVLQLHASQSLDNMQQLVTIRTLAITVPLR